MKRMLLVVLLASIVFVPEAFGIIMGDANLDGSVDIGDAVYIVNFIFKNGPPPLKLDMVDVQVDCHPTTFYWHHVSINSAMPDPSPVSVHLDVCDTLIKILWLPQDRWIRW